MSTVTQEVPSYWYDPDTDADARRVLEALRTFRRADEEMRHRASRDMDMNLTDLRALQHVIARAQRDEPVTPRALADHLGISTASTTKLLDRLGASGHLERRPHPGDRRSVVVVATDGAHAEVRDRLARMHARMLTIARDVPPAARGAVVDFLHAMAAELAREHDDEAARSVAGGATRA